MIALENFKEHLGSITPRQWSGLFSLIPKIERTNVFGSIVESKLQPDGSYTFPYWEEHEIVSRVSEILYGELNLPPVYDWMKWEEGSTLLRSGSDLKTLDMVTLCKLLTCIYRTDRFSEGHVISMFNDGTILRLLKALQYRVQENNFPKSEG